MIVFIYCYILRGISNRDNSFSVKIIIWIDNQREIYTLPLNIIRILITCFLPFVMSGMRWRLSEVDFWSGGVIILGLRRVCFGIKIMMFRGSVWAIKIPSLARNRTQKSFAELRGCIININRRILINRMNIYPNRHRLISHLSWVVSLLAPLWPPPRSPFPLPLPWPHLPYPPFPTWPMELACWSLEQSGWRWLPPNMYNLRQSERRGLPLLSVPWAGAVVPSGIGLLVRTCQWKLLKSFPY